MSAAHIPGRVTFREDGDACHWSILTEDGRWWLALLHNGEQTAPQQIERFRRLAACWNACDGLTTEQLERCGTLDRASVSRDVATQHKQIAAYKLLTESQEAQLSRHRAQADKFREAIATLQSEREANAILTAAIERKDALLRQALEAMRKAFDEDYFLPMVKAITAITKELQ